ncbi:prepronociceptin isoform X2 [Sceloporus undulatus]|nr:prepronociceptin isoform X2 [Sceloporus undulatus]XP_042300968.1 prepronociceptin isoform X2 [Sceloporus undulatus]
MRIFLWSVLLFCAFAYALSDCRKDCLSCHRHLYSQQDDFSLLICVMECEGRLFSRATWDLCNKATSGKASSLPLSFGILDDEDDRPLEFWNGRFLRSRGSLQPSGDLTRVVDLSKDEGEKRVSKMSSLIRQPPVEEEGTSDGGRQDPLGDFLSRSFTYGQLADPGVQELQKRFGGFIGVRKSARKWHNQKRFSEFLKQYLGMSPRSVEYDGLADNDLKEQNEI